MFKTICIFCGSSNGDSEIFKETAKKVGKEIADRNMTLIYGAGNVGLMGELARSVLSEGGSVIGIIPEKLHKMVEHVELTETHIVPDMHKRKAMMYEMADAFVALPGGIGTIEELFECYTWSQIGYHLKPLGLLNIDGYYDELIAFLDTMEKRQFLQKAHREFLKESNNFAQLLDTLIHSPLTSKSKL